MKTTPPIYILFFLTFLKAYPQKNEIIYFDENWRKTTVENAKFYREISDKKNADRLYQVTDYFMSGEKQMTGFIKSLKKENMHGGHTWYYKNGAISSKATFEKNKKIGESYKYYKNGNICQKGLYIDGEYIIISAYDSIGNQTLSDKKGVAYFIDMFGRTTGKGEFEEGKTHGTFEGYDFKEKISFIENYSKGKLISGISTDTIGNKYTYSKILIPANFQGGDKNSFGKYITSHITYPSYHVSNGIKDKILCKFIIEKDGIIRRIRLLKSSTFIYMNKEVLRVFINSPSWKPTIYRGMPITAQYVLPIVFIY